MPWTKAPGPAAGNPMDRLQGRGVEGKLVYDHTHPSQAQGDSRISSVHIAVRHDLFDQHKPRYQRNPQGAAHHRRTGAASVMESRTLSSIADRTQHGVLYSFTS